MLSVLCLWVLVVRAGPIPVFPPDDVPETDLGGNEFVGKREVGEVEHEVLPERGSGNEVGSGEVLPERGSGEVGSGEVLPERGSGDVESGGQ